MKSPPSLIAVLKKTAGELALFESGAPLAAAVSGGADSIALLHALASLAPRRDHLVVAHLNHGIRGAAAARDAAFVRARCRELKVSLFEGQADVPALAAERGLSLEMAARTARYRFFRDTLDKAGAKAVATAHTADDQAETVLLKLLRGAGPRGLSGISARAVILGVPMVRPFLSFSRAEVLAYLKSIGQTWREDRTNQDWHPLRNRIRHALLPDLEKHFNPRIRASLARTAAILRDEEDWLQPMVQKALARTVREGCLDVTRLRRLPVPLARRVIRDWLLKGGLAEEYLTFELVDRIEGLGDRSNGTIQLDAGGGMQVLGEYGVWRMALSAPENRPEAVLAVPGVTLLPDWGIRVTVSRTTGYEKKTDPGVGKMPCRAYMSASKIGPYALKIRAWKPGDRLVVPAGTKKLQDLFSDAKVPRLSRVAIPVFVAGDEVVWAAGGPVSLGCRVAGPRSPSFRVDVTSLQRPSETPISDV
jgi:tRNA(Ile)-lysidine synthase